jgi:hypothetical protein
MEIILKTDNAVKVAKVIALAKELDIAVEQRGGGESNEMKEVLKNRILNYKAETKSSFGDAVEWERNQRQDRTLPSFE